MKKKAVTGESDGFTLAGMKIRFMDEREDFLPVNL
jgi:hypothetical protein